MKIINYLERNHQLQLLGYWYGIETLRAYIENLNKTYIVDILFGVLSKLKLRLECNANLADFWRGGVFNIQEMNNSKYQLFAETKETILRKSKFQQKVLKFNPIFVTWKKIWFLWREYRFVLSISMFFIYSNWSKN